MRPYVLRTSPGMSLLVTGFHCESDGSTGVREAARGRVERQAGGHDEVREHGKKFHQG